MLSNLRNCRQRLRFRNEAPVHHAQFCDPDGCGACPESERTWQALGASANDFGTSADPDRDLSFPLNLVFDLSSIPITRLAPIAGRLVARQPRHQGCA